MSTHRNLKAKRRPAKSGSNAGLALVVVGALVALGALLFAVFGGGSGAGSPRLAVDKERIDFGDVKYNVPVTASFVVTNTGDAPLRFTKEPWVELKEGCWPPPVAIGSMVLQPGESTEMYMTFTMHEGMAGPHDFRVHLPSNDRSWGDKTLVVLSNWIP